MIQEDSHAYLPLFCRLDEEKEREGQDCGASKKSFIFTLFICITEKVPGRSSRATFFLTWPSLHSSIFAAHSRSMSKSSVSMVKEGS